MENNIEKKKFSKKVKIAIIAAVLLLGGASVYAVSEYDDIAELQRAAEQLPVAEETQPEQSATVEVQPDVQQSDETFSADIGLEKARSIALAEVSGAAESDILAAYSDYDDGRLEYDVTILYDGYEYDFEIDGADGKILGKDVDRMEYGDSDYYGY